MGIKVLESQWKFFSSQDLSQNLFGKGIRRPVTFTSGVELHGPKVENWVWRRGM